MKKHLELCHLIRVTEVLVAASVVKKAACSSLSTSGILHCIRGTSEDVLNWDCPENCYSPPAPDGSVL